jgi:hypothetical protein
MPKAAISISRFLSSYEVNPTPLIVVLSLCTWTTLVNLMIWCWS